MEKGRRCFGDGKPFYEHYHDHEWGRAVHDDNHLFEMLCLEGAQAGLSWETVLKKREGYRTLFHYFDTTKVAAMSDKELEKALENPGIVRNRLKVFSVRTNARVALDLKQEFGSLDRYLWSFVDGKPIINYPKQFSDVPVKTDQSDALSKDLKKRGMKFVGTTIIYAFMQAVGMVDDHLVTCPFKVS